MSNENTATTPATTEDLLLWEAEHLTAAEREARMIERLVQAGYTVSAEGPTCCICGHTIPTVSTPEGEATTIGQNNPAPIVDDDDSVCCASCNESYVIPSRMGKAHANAALLLALADRMRTDGREDVAVHGVVALADMAIVA